MSRRKKPPTETEMIDALKLLGSNLDRTPQWNDSIPGVPKHRLIARFGTWNRALMAAGFKPNRDTQVKIAECVDCKVSFETYTGTRCFDCMGIRSRKHACARIAKKSKEGGVWLLRKKLNSKLDNARRRATEQNVPFNLTIEYLLDLFDSQEGRCHYTGQTMTYEEGESIWTAASLDRTIPSKGYAQGNVVFCTYFVNTSKGQLTEEEFYAFCQSVANHRFAKTSTISSI